jgi:hypothetical protein
MTFAAGSPSSSDGSPGYAPEAARGLRRKLAAGADRERRERRSPERDVVLADSVGHQYLAEDGSWALPYSRSYRFKLRERQVFGGN